MKNDKSLTNLILENQIIIMKALKDMSELSNSKKKDLEAQIEKTMVVKNC
jgi:hypothetical protein